jgi:hypothetical protein
MVPIAGDFVPMMHARRRWDAEFDAAVRELSGCDRRLIDIRSITGA